VKNRIRKTNDTRHIGSHNLKTHAFVGYQYGSVSKDCFCSSHNSLGGLEAETLYSYMVDVAYIQNVPRKQSHDFRNIELDKLYVNMVVVLTRT